MSIPGGRVPDITHSSTLSFFRSNKALSDLIRLSASIFVTIVDGSIISVD